MRLVIFIISSVVATLTLDSLASDLADNSVLAEKFSRNMDEAATWIITNGLYEYSTNGKQAIRERLQNQWAVQLWVDPWVNSDGHIAQFRIKGRGINYDIHALYRECIDSDYFEYWVAKIVAEDWSGETNRTVFFVVRTDGLFGIRSIEIRSAQFIEKFLAIRGAVFRLPIDDLAILYRLEAWEFPESYIKQQELSSRKVVINRNGQYSVCRWLCFLH